MILKYKNYFIFFILFFVLNNCFCQKQDSVTRFLEIGTSANSYKGDLNSSFKIWNGSFQMGLKMNFKKRLNGHLAISYGTISGSNSNYNFITNDTTQATSNTFFKTRFLSINYDIQINIYRNKNWIVYISQGFGFMRFTPKDANNQSLINQLNTRAGGETYNQVALILPTQIGFYYFLNNGYGINFQTGFLNSQTDYLDNISQWGNRSKKDNVLWCKFAFVVPLTFKK